MTVYSGEVYACDNPSCAAKVLILKPPDAGWPEASMWRCMCGGLFELESTAESAVPDLIPVHSMQPATSHADQDPE